MSESSNFDDARAEIGAAEAEYNELVRKYQAATLDDAADDALIASLKAELAAAKAHDATHHQPVPPDPEPKPPVPAKRSLLIGCNKGTIPGCASLPQIVRIYGGQQFAAVSAGLGTDTNWGDHVGKRSIAITFADQNLTGLDTRVKTFLDSVPKAQMTGKHRLYVTDVHEPERGDKANDPAACRAWTKTVALAVRAWRANAPRQADDSELNVWANPNVMGWFERDAATAGTSSRDWWPHDIDLSDVVLGIDPYDPLLKQEIDAITEPTLTLWRLDGGKRYNLPEINTKRTGAAGRDWWNRTFANVDADGCEGLMLFLHNSAGQYAPWTTDAGPTFDAAIKARPV